MIIFVSVTILVWEKDFFVGFHLMGVITNWSQDAYRNIVHDEWLL